jgi:hypothetical protein
LTKSLKSEQPPPPTWKVRSPGDQRPATAGYVVVGDVAAKYMVVGDTTVADEAVSTETQRQLMRRSTTQEKHNDKFMMKM